jgi:hypothetical protein
VPRPVQQTPQKRNYKVGPAPWIIPTYYGIAIYWVVGGSWTCFSSSGVIHGLGHSVLGMVIGAVTAMFGLGLIAKLELIRGIVNVFSFLSILTGLLNLYSSLIFLSILPLIGIIGVVFAIIQICTAGLMIYLIGETDDAPGF